MQVINIRGNYQGGAQEERVHGNSLYYPLNFSVNLKLL